MALLLELLLELVLGPLVEVFLEAVIHLLGRFGRGIFQMAIILVLGAITGVAFSAFFPDPVVPAFIPGASLVVSPVLAGITMHVFGRRRDLKGHEPTWLASFWGGALFGLAVAASRLLAVAH